jgi:hypothetical protein
MPATAIYVLVGCGVDEVINSSATLSMQLMMRPSILLPLLGLALLSFLPLIYKSIQKSKQTR